MESIKRSPSYYGVTSLSECRFYRNILGQRLVKENGQFRCPDTYHLYFADETGTPGSVLTFCMANVKRGARGNGETAAGI
jgi:glyoxalase family protein